MLKVVIRRAPGGADAPAPGGRRSGRASRFEPRLPRVDRRRPDRARVAAAAAGDPHVRAGRVCSMSGSPVRTGSPRRRPTSRCWRRCRTRRAAPGTARAWSLRFRTSTWRTALARSAWARASPRSSCISPRRYFGDLGIDVKVVWSFGATEAKVPRSSTRSSTSTETGSTLRAHGRRSSRRCSKAAGAARNRAAAADPSKRAAMDDVTTLLLGVLRAEGRASSS